MVIDTMRILLMSFFVFFSFFSTSIIAATSFSLSVTELEKIAASQPVILIDARPAESFNEGHLENAVSLPFTDTFTQFGQTGRVIGINEAQTLFSQAGIEPNTLVVAYDDHPGSLQAARVLWTLLTYGHTQIKLLDGGLAAAIQNGQKLTTEATKVQASNFIPTFNPETYASRRTAIEASNNLQDFALIDARQTEHFEGLESMAKRFGHIPNAVSIDFRLNMQADGSLRPMDELKALYQSIPKDKKVVVYCHMGDASALEYFILKELGYQVTSYDASWQEWGNDLTLPVVKPHKN